MPRTTDVEHNYEAFFDIGEVIAREKQIKGGSRQKKIDLINALKELFYQGIEIHYREIVKFV